MGVVDLHQGFHDSVDVHRDGARHVVPEHEVVVQGFDVSIDDQPDDFEQFVYDDTSGAAAGVLPAVPPVRRRLEGHVAAGDIVRADEVDGLRHVDLVLAVEPDPRQVEGVLVVELAPATVEPVERRAVRRDRAAQGERTMNSTRLQGVPNLRKCVTPTRVNWGS